MTDRPTYTEQGVLEPGIYRDGSMGGWSVRFTVTTRNGNRRVELDRDAAVELARDLLRAATGDPV